jgi:hypothetical protein
MEVGSAAAVAHSVGGGELRGGRETERRCGHGRRTRQDC